MGRDATKAAGNPWYQARKKAAEYDDRLERCGHDWKTASEEDIPDGYDG